MLVLMYEKNLKDYCKKDVKLCIYIDNEFNYPRTISKIKELLGRNDVSYLRSCVYLKIYRLIIFIIAQTI